jgi:hypothetical protein
MDAFRSAADSGSSKLFSSYQSSDDAGDISTVRDFTTAQMADLAKISVNADTATNDLLVDAADTLADIDQQARGLCGTCSPTKSVALPNALTAGAGAVSMANLIARPVSQVQSDVKAVAAVRAARLKALQNNAEKEADKLPLLPTGTVTGDGTTDYALPGSSGKPGDPFTSSVTPDGKLLPRIASGATVKDLVSGVTGPLDEATGGATAPLTDPLTDAVEKLGDTATDLLP